MEGWVKIHRKMVNWEWYNDNNTKILFLHLLLTANHKDNKWQGILVLRGQKLTSLKHLSEETNLTLRQVRTSLDRLKSTGEIAIETTNKNTLITIEKYSDYQCSDTQNDKQTTNERQANDKQTTTNKNDNNDNNNLFILNKEEEKSESLYEKFLEKYKSSEKDFYKKLKAISKMRDDPEYDKLTHDEQMRLQTEIFRQVS